MPHYSMEDKLLEPISPGQFEQAFETLKPIYKAYLILIYYTGVRVGEALRLTKECFKLQGQNLYVEVGIRFKTQCKRKDGTMSKGKQTKPLPLDITQPHMDILLKRVKYTRKGKKVFPFVQSTAWRQIHKAGLGYNHHARLTAITFFLKAGRSIVDIVNWFGVSVQTVNEYIGSIDLEEMGSLRR